MCQSTSVLRNEDPPSPAPPGERDRENVMLCTHMHMHT